MRVFVFLVIFFLSQYSVAAPRELEVWFLSSSFQKLKAQGRDIASMKLLAKSEPLCQKVGEYCFDPQLGLYQKQNNDEIKMVDFDRVIEKEQEKKLFKEIGHNDVVCDERQGFDIFCNEKKSKSNSAKSKQQGSKQIEVWFDISSSMREMDGVDQKGQCFRQSFAQRVKMHCEENVRFKVFQSSLKEIDQHSRVCETRGLADEQRLLQWIRNSGAEKLIVITDIYQLSKKLSDLIYRLQGEMYGHQADRPLIAEDLLSRVEGIAKFCPKN